MPENTKLLASGVVAGAGLATGLVVAALVLGSGSPPAGAVTPEQAQKAHSLEQLQEGLAGWADAQQEVGQLLARRTVLVAELAEIDAALAVARQRLPTVRAVAVARKEIYDAQAGVTLPPDLAKAQGAGAIAGWQRLVAQEAAGTATPGSAAVEGGP